MIQGQAAWMLRNTTIRAVLQCNSWVVLGVSFFALFLIYLTLHRKHSVGFTPPLLNRLMQRDSGTSGDENAGRGIKFIRSDDSESIRFIAYSVHTSLPVGLPHLLQALHDTREGGSSDALCKALANSVPYRAFAVEFPALQSLHAASSEPPTAAFRVVDSPVLANANVDSKPFKHMLSSDTCKAPPYIAVFKNLGGDATLVAPCPHPDATSDLKEYAHIASFVRLAPAEQQRQLWHIVALELERSVSASNSSKPVWLSTAGEGVFYLHVRLDSSPKYYKTSYAHAHLSQL